MGLSGEKSTNKSIKESYRKFREKSKF